MLNIPKNEGFSLSKKNSRKEGLRIGNREEAAPGTPLHRKNLDGKVKGEANIDGTIFIDHSVEPNSLEERLILNHEMKHLTDMKIGKLFYDDNHIKWNGEEFPRDKGKILYNGEWIPEGSKAFPWEQH